MSLVNDMLRDLEARRAAPAERLELGGIHAVDETGAARRERFERMRRWLLVLLAVMVLAIASALFIKRTLDPVAPPEIAPVESIEPAVAAPEAVASTQLLEVLPQNDGRRFVLQLLLDGSPSYQRIDQEGSVSIRLDSVQLIGDARSGRVEKNGQSLSWRLEGQGDDVQVQLVGLADGLDVRDRLEPAGDRWQLWLEAALVNKDGSIEGMQSLPVAEPADMDETQLPDWVTRDAPPASPQDEPRASAKPAAHSEAENATAELPRKQAQPQMNIGSHQPNRLSLAQQALQDGDHLRAINELQALHQAQPSNPEVIRWLARAYLAAGDAPAVLAWLPSQLQARPFDAQLRELLARAQLLGGDNVSAVATLQQNPPELSHNTGYHALLAALHQQVGDWAASAVVYRQLLTARPSQAAWHLGLAIALEQLDQPAQASRHYRLASQGQGLDDSSRRFAIERAGSSGGSR
jgi:MSHA biogenesis protein MshN